MKKLLAILWLTVSFAYAQDQSTPNLITSGTNHTWTGVVTGADPRNCCTGGPSPLYDPATNTIHFSYGNATVAQTFAINQALALSGSGIQVTGYNYSWDVWNNAQNGADPLTVNVLTYNYNNTLVRRTDSWTYTATHNWLTYSGHVGYDYPGPPSDFGNLTVKFSSIDRGYWAGYYGPKVRNVNIGMTYSVDQCSVDPLSSTTCAGYAQAWTNLQCSGNPLYSPSCPGYAQAYFTQQCTVNALSDPSCPGYAGAYLTYQCNANPLYSTTCPGYDQAYFNQQCGISQLYSQSCSGYSVAYHDKQCTLNPLYATDCVGYAAAYAVKNILNVKPVVLKTIELNADTTSTVSTGNTTVDTVISNTGATSTSATSTTSVLPISVTSVIQQPTANAGIEGKKDVSGTGISPSTVTQATAQDSGSKDQPKTARQELQEKRVAQAKAKAVEEGKNVAENVGKAANMEAQKQLQNVIIQAMGYTPGFDTYNLRMQDANNYKPFTVYNKQIKVDNARLGRQIFGTTEKLHDDLVKMQFEIE